MGYIILFFIAGPVIIEWVISYWDRYLINAPLHVQFRSFIIGSLVYLILATVCYFCYFKANYNTTYSMS